VSLSDNYVSLHDLQTYTLLERLEKTKGATLFAPASNIVKDDSTGIPSIVSRLAVAAKRKIFLWTWQDMELSPDTTELTLVAAAKSLTWLNSNKIVVGLDSGYVIVDIVTMEISDVSKPGGLDEVGSRFGAVSSTGMGYMGMGSWVPKPMASKLGDKEMLLARDVNTLFIDEDGKALDKRQVPWPTAPDAIGYSYPYMLALQAPTKGILEVRNPDTLTLLQSIPLANATLLHVPQPNISLAHAGKDFLVGSERCIWRMSALGYDKQIEDLVAQNHYDEAISLISLLEDTLLLGKEDRLRSIKAMKAQVLFDRRKYRESLELFSDAEAPPFKVIRMYPKSIAGDISIIQDELVEEETDEQESPDAAAEGKKSIPNSPKSTPRKGYLARFRADPKLLDSDSSSIKSTTTAHGTDNGNGRCKAGDDKPLEGRDLIMAVNELCAFLAQTRVKIKKTLNPDGTMRGPLRRTSPEDGRPDFHHLIVLEDDQDNVDWHQKLLEVATLVDTTLFRAYMLARPGLAGSLFRLDNFCDPTVVRDKLYETGRYADLIDFLHGKKLHREALETLEKFGKDVDNEAISPTLRGPRRMVAYLQQLPPEQIDLILEFGVWPIKFDASIGMEIFLADTENAETLPRHRVVEFLQGIDERLTIQYLEHIISELNDLTPDFHQQLIDLYLKGLKEGTDSLPEDGGFTNEEEKVTLLEKLESFLRGSDQYNRARVFGKLPSEGRSLRHMR